MTADNYSNNNQDVDNASPTDEQPSTPQQKEPVKGPGKLLQEARETQGLSQRDVADRLRLRLQIIELIEADEYDSFSTPTFIKGYLKAYGKVLDVDEDEILAAYRSLNIKEPDNTSMQSFSRRVKHQENDNRLMLITYVVIIVVIGLVVWWWQDSDFSFDQLSQDVEQAVEQSTDKDQAAITEPEQTSTTQPASSNDDEANDPLLESEVQAGDTSTSLSSNDPATTELDMSGEGSSDNDSSTSVNDHTASGTTVTGTEQPETVLSDVNEPVANDTTANDDANADNDSEPATTVTDAVEQGSELEQVNQSSDEATAVPQLVFQFSQECWVKVDDADGETQAVGIKPQGYEMPVPGVAPFSVTVCKPEAVAITYQGEEVDLSNFRQSRVARFTVPLSN